MSNLNPKGLYSSGIAWLSRDTNYFNWLGSCQIFISYRIGIKVPVMYVHYTSKYLASSGIAWLGTETNYFNWLGSCQLFRSHRIRIKVSVMYVQFIPFIRRYHYCLILVYVCVSMVILCFQVCDGFHDLHSNSLLQFDMPLRHIALFSASKSRF